MEKMSGNSILIIGGTTGIGEALAKQLESEGHKVYAAGRSSKDYAVDVLGVDSLKALRARVGKPDIVVFCAGAYWPMGSTQIDLEKAQAILDINLKGAVNAAAVFLPDMIAEKTGHWVNVSSVAGYFGMPNSFGYSASKAGLTALTEEMYIELKRHNIKVQLVSPGFVKTRLTEKNSFDMPFIISSDKAAAIIAKGLRQNRFEISFPRRLVWMLKIMRVLPAKIRMFLLGKL